MELNKNFWEKQYESQSTPWDIGQVSPPLKAYIDTLKDKDQLILLPGAGKAHEAIYLHQQGFTRVYVCDWAEKAFDHLKKCCPSFPKEHLLVQDFFEMSGRFDLLLEQTFFCALPPSKRPAYIEQSANLLKKGGTLAGLLFASHFQKDGPPFGGTKEEYLPLFSTRFDIIEMEIAPNSILPRQGNELFCKMKKK